MNPDCPYCWLKDGANIDHVCDVVNVKKNLDTQWEITAETQRNLERAIHSKQAIEDPRERQSRCLGDVLAKVNYYIQEYRFTYAEIVGMLEILKMRFAADWLDEEDEVKP